MRRHLGRRSRRARSIITSTARRPRPYLTKTFTHQLGLSGNQFSDAGDSGALVVDAANAEPVGLYFAGGTDVSGVSEGVANPASEVLNELGAQLGGGSYTFVGAADHAVSCLSYGDNTLASAQNRPLSDAEYARAQQGLAQARMFVNSSAGILGVAAGKSSDHPGEAAVILYTDENRTVIVPATLDGVRTVAIPTTAGRWSYGSAPQTPLDAAAVSLPASALAQAVAIKNQMAAGLMRQNPAFFGVGVGQSLDNPREAALVIYVDRNRLPAQLPAIIGRPAHPLRGDGPAARDSFLRGSIAISTTLHAAHAGNKPPVHRD